MNNCIGTYSSSDGNTLSINENYTSISGSINIGGNAILINGNTLIIYDYSNNKKHTIVFSDDKQTATYTDPDTQQKVTLTKQGA